jgi:hypothetical protein
MLEDGICTELNREDIAAEANAMSSYGARSNR